MTNQSINYQINCRLFFWQMTYYCSSWLCNRLHRSYMTGQCVSSSPSWVRPLHWSHQTVTQHKVKMWQRAVKTAEMWHIRGEYQTDTLPHFSWSFTLWFICAHNARTFCGTTTEHWQKKGVCQWCKSLKGEENKIHVYGHTCCKSQWPEDATGP